MTEQDFLPRKINYNRLALLRDLHHLHSLNKAAASDVSLAAGSFGLTQRNEARRGERQSLTSSILLPNDSNSNISAVRSSSQQFALLLPSIPSHPNSISITKLKKAIRKDGLCYT